MKALRTLALQYPECEEGIACKGTAIECTTFKARSKAFLFVARADVRIKLRESLPEAAKLAVKEPGRYTDVLELMYLCLSLGFEGRMRVAQRGASELSRTREGLFNLLRHGKGSGLQLRRKSLAHVLLP